MSNFDNFFLKEVKLAHSNWHKKIEPKTSRRNTLSYLKSI